MTIYGTLIINKSRKPRKCGDCQQDITGRHIRTFGCGMEGDPPYNLYLHRECIHPEWNDEKIKAICAEFDKDSP